jgi:hypothetical protein
MKRKATALLTVAVLLAGCATAKKESRETREKAEAAGSVEKDTYEESEAPDWAPIYADQAPERQPYAESERQIQDFMSYKVIPPNVFTEGGNEYFKQQLKRKGDAQRRIERDILTGLREDQAEERPASYVAFRVAQTYFDFACQLHWAKAPELDNPEAEKIFREQLNQYATPMLLKARVMFKNSADRPSKPWSGKAAAIVEDIPTEMPDVTPKVTGYVCQTHRQVWASPAALQRAAAEVRQAGKNESEPATTSEPDSLQAVPEAEDQIREDEAEGGEESDGEAGLRGKE